MTVTINRRTALGGLALAGLARPALAQGEQWPRQPVRIIVPYPAGGSTDVLTRILAERLKDKLGGTWVVENRPGAGGNVGIDAAAKSDPDGHTIGSATVGHFSINQYLYSRMAYDSDRDFAPVSMTWWNGQNPRLAWLKTPSRTTRIPRPCAASSNSRSASFPPSSGSTW